jgi:SAM-dependent methyltransferase
MKSGNPPYKLNVGCGRNIQQGWINLDSVPLPDVDIVCDLESVRANPIALPDGSVEQFLLSHVIEHVRDSLGLMQELWRLATPGAIAVIRVPHGGSDDAWEDPTHVRAYFPGSCGYLSQPFYSNADYGYRADWNPDKLTLLVHRSLCAGLNPQQIISKSQSERNVVKEMICELRAVKPMREARRELQTRGQIEILPVD